MPNLLLAEFWVGPGVPNDGLVFGMVLSPFVFIYLLNYVVFKI
jgi:hypothetical protein